MKNTNLILNLVLLVAVAILFALHFSGSKTTKESAPALDLAIAYVNTDSILMNYELSLALHEELTKSQTSYTNEYAKKRSDWEVKATRFQEKVQRGGFLTEERAVQERNQLTNEQDELMKLDQELSSKLAEMQNKNTNTVIDSLMSAINRYNSTKKYAYILSSNSILATDGGINVTADILKILNDEYPAKN
ncbi:MAG: OmpH family outer membrane protein [Mangrovibacterium sp.]